eukprot:403351862
MTHFMTQKSKQSVLNDNKINRQPFVQIRKLAENPLSPQKHYNIDSINQIQNLPQVKEFLDKDVKKYFKYKDQYNANINSVKQQIDSIKQDLKQTISGSSTTDYKHPHQQIKRGDLSYFSSSQSASQNSEPQYKSNQLNQKPQKQRIINGKNQKKEIEEVILEDVDHDTQLRPRDMSEYLSQPRMKSAATNLMPIKIPSRQAGPFLTQKMSSFNSKQNTRTPIAINPNQINMPLTARNDQQRRNPFSQSGLDFSSQNEVSDGIENAQNDHNSNKVVIENERNLVKSSKQKADLKYLLELHNRIVNINKIPQFQQTARNLYSENKILSSKLSTNNIHSENLDQKQNLKKDSYPEENQKVKKQVREFKKVETHIAKKLQRSNTQQSIVQNNNTFSVSHPDYQSKISVLNQLKDYDQYVQSQQTMKKQLDSIVALALNKNTKKTQNKIKPLKRQIHLELSKIFQSEEEIRDVHNELNLIGNNNNSTLQLQSSINDASNQKQSRLESPMKALQKEINHLNKDHYLQLRHYDKDVLGSDIDELDSQNLDEIDAVDIEFYRFKFRFQAQIQECQNQRSQVQLLIEKYKEIFQNDKLKDKYSDFQSEKEQKSFQILTQLYKKINQYLDKVLAI